jgi:hypothetical protein
MKKILLLPFLYFSLYASSYNVQVIAVKKPSSLTKTFLKKVKKCQEHYATLHQGHYIKVQVGNFTTYAAAKEALGFFRKKVAKDAFIVHQKSTATKNVIASAHPKQIVHNTTIETKTLHTTVAKTTPPAQKSKTLSDCVEKCLCKTKREDEIAAAIAYYKHAGIYKFSH